MESNQTSEQIVMPDISDPLANNPEEHQNITLDRSKCSVVTSVQEGLPVGSLIGVTSPSGTTFNVITHDQLQVIITSPLYHSIHFSILCLPTRDIFFRYLVLISLKDRFCALTAVFYVKHGRKKKMIARYEVG